MKTEILSAVGSLRTSEKISQSAHVDYYLVKGTCKTDGLFGIPVYGIRADLVMSGDKKDTAVVEDITSSPEQCKTLIDLLARSSVTPVCLKDVVEDILATGLEQIFLMSAEST